MATQFAGLLKDHMVLGLPTMPGVMALELALAAAEQCKDRPMRRISQVVFQRPLCLSAQHASRTRIYFDDSGGFRLSSARAASNGPERWTEHVTATVHDDFNGSAPFFDLAEAAQRCRRDVDVAGMYRWFREAGLTYGPQFQTIASARSGERDVVAELRLSPVSEPDAKRFRLHPCLLDGALQSIGCLAIGAATQNEVYLPHKIDEVLVWGEVNGPVFSHVRVLEVGDPTANSRVNVTVTDKMGSVLVKMNGVSFKRVPLASTQSSAAYLDWLYRRQWNEESGPRPPEALPAGPWLVFRDTNRDGGITTALVETLSRHGANIIEVVPGETFDQRGASVFSVCPQRGEDYTHLLARLRSEGRFPTQIIHAWNATCSEIHTAQELHQCMANGVISVFHLVRAISADKEFSRAPLTVLSTNSHAVPEAPAPNPENGAAWGFTRVASLECPSVRIRCVDVRSADPLPDIASHVIAECASTDRSPEIVYSGGKRWVPRFDHFTPPNADAGARPIVNGGVYVVTGGMGGIGLEVARWLARGRHVKLALLGRTPPPNNGASDERSRRVAAALAEIRAGGSECLALSVDVGDERSLAEVLDRVRRELGPIRGVFHAAGCIKDQLLRNKDENAFRDVLRPKIYGAFHLDQLTRNDPMDFLVLFSSVVSIGGNVGQCDYAAANRYLDCYAAWRTSLGKKTLSIEWGPWAEVGMAAKLADVSRKAGIEPLPVQQAIAAMEALLSTSEPCVAVISMSEAARDRFGFAATQGRAPSASPAPEVAGGKVDVAEVEELLIAEMSKFLEIGADYIDREASFQDMGIDSIMASDLMRELESQSSMKLSPAVFFEATSVATLAEALAEHLTPENIALWRQRRDLPASSAAPKPPSARPAASHPLSETGPAAELTMEPAPTAVQSALKPSADEQGCAVETEVDRLFVEQLADFLGIDESNISMDCDLADLGLDPVSLGAFCEQIEHLTGAKLPHAMLVELAGVTAFKQCLARFLTGEQLEVWRSHRSNNGQTEVPSGSTPMPLTEPTGKTPRAEHETETPPNAEKAHAERTTQLLCISAETSDALHALAADYAHLLERVDAPPLADVCYSACEGRAHLPYRLAITGSSPAEIAAQLRSIQTGRPARSVRSGHVLAPPNIRAGFLFTGQGAQYPGMGRELYESHPSVRDTLDRADEALRKDLERPLLDVMYGSAADTALLKETCYTQPALFALEFALAEMWRSLGVEPAAVLGHSVGEYVAACIAGVFDFETGLKLVAERGRLLQSLPRTGSMVVALCAESRVIDALRGYEGSVSIAAVNGPQNTVMSGEREAVDRVVSTLEAGGVKCRPLNVSHAFHSTQVEPILDAFTRALAQFRFAPPRIPIISNVSGCVLSDADAMSPQYWRRHLREGVRFADGISGMAQLGCNFLIEAGPQPTLIGMGRRVLDRDDVVWLPSLVQGQPDWTAFLTSVGELHCRGLDVDWNGFDKRRERRHVPATDQAPSESSQATAPAELPVPDPSDAAKAYADFARPRISRQLHVGQLDRCYHRACGDRLWYMAADREIEVLDLIGGFGAGLFGHNHPELVEHARMLLNANRPIQAQASIRGEAALLCRELSAQLTEYTGEQYVVTLVNSGAEAIEAAIKHAETEYQSAVSAWQLKFERASVLLAHEYHGKAWMPSQDLFDRLCSVLGEDKVRGAGLDQIQRAISDHNECVLGARPVFLALHSAFHGRTRGAAALTASYDTEAGPKLEGLHVVRLESDDVSLLEKNVEHYARELWQLRQGVSGEPVLTSQPWTQIAGLFLEPMRGEGGVLPLPPAFVTRVNELRDVGLFPVIVDEIQAGFGRCGAFTAAEALGLRGHYYVFAKSLGGSIAKTAALCIERKRYQDEFGGTHTSTFGEDDYSSGIARLALKIFRRDNLAGRCAAIGQKFMERLRGLQAKYPTVIADVRGRGCMIGLELCDTASSPSTTLRSRSDAIGFVAAGYLLNEERIRVLPTMSSPRTLRIQPSAYFSDADIDRCIDALDRLCRIIECANAGRLLRYVLHPDSTGPAKFGDFSKSQRLKSDVVLPSAPSVAFAVYYIDEKSIVNLDPSMGDLPEGEREELIRALCRDVYPAVLLSTNRIQSITGDTVNVHLIGMMLTSRIMEEAWRAGDADWILGHLQRAVDLACKLKCQTIGFAGFLSIASYNCKRLATSRIGLTTGNSLTVGTGIESLCHHARRLGIDIAASTLGIVGATGNISTTYAQIMAKEVGAMVLIGRLGSSKATESTAALVYEVAWEQVQTLPTDQLTGIAARIANSKAVRTLRNGLPAGERVGLWLHRNISSEMGEAAPVVTSEELGSLVRCNLIVTASNASDPIVFEHHLGPGPVVICDIAVPADVSPTIRETRSDVVVTTGGCVRLPLGQAIETPGVELPFGNIFACEAETIVLGLAKRTGHFSFGPVDPKDVAEIGALAKQHGFVLGDDVSQSGGQLLYTT